MPVHEECLIVAVATAATQAAGPAAAGPTAAWPAAAGCATAGPAAGRGFLFHDNASTWARRGGGTNCLISGGRLARPGDRA